MIRPSSPAPIRNQHYHQSASSSSCSSSSSASAADEFRRIIFDVDESCYSDADGGVGRRLVDGAFRGGAGVSLVGDVAAGDGGGPGCRREPRTSITGSQLAVLVESFAESSKPSRGTREELAMRTGLTARVIQVNYNIEHLLSIMFYV